MLVVPAILLSRMRYGTRRPPAVRPMPGGFRGGCSSQGKSPRANFRGDGWMDRGCAGWLALRVACILLSGSGAGTRSVRLPHGLKSMKARTSITGTRTGLEIVEEAVHLLRLAPLRLWSLYLIGAAPFCLVFTYFIADMSRSAFASEQLIVSSLWLALSFQWKQCWQAVFAAELYALMEGGRLDRTWSKVWRMVTLQCAIQPFSLVILPLSLITVFPFPYTVALFRNVTLYAGLGREKPVRQARQYSGLWTGQAWTALSILTLLALLLFINYLVTLAVLPQLLKSFFGIENQVTRYSQWVLNSTVMTATAMLVYLSLDPLLDAVYVLRCFYSESIATGTDLRAGLRRAVSMVALMLCLAGGSVLQADPPIQARASTAPGIDKQRLERSIDETVRRREFTWNSPKTSVERENSKFVGWVRSFWRGVKRFVNSIWDWFQRVFFPDESLTDSKNGKGSSTAVVRWLLIALGIGFVLLIVYIFYRQSRAQGRRLQAKPVAAVAVINLEDDSVTADQLPEDSWYSLAREWIDKGDYRLALRALYLGAISHLGQRELVSIQRWKSGLDYSRELARRTRATPEVAPAFAKTVLVFECGWYGRHTVDRDTLDRFSAGFEEVRRSAK